MKKLLIGLLLSTSFLFGQIEGVFSNFFKYCIAISKTLTELSGASSIGILAFDEIFESQDEVRRIEIKEMF